MSLIPVLTGAIQEQQEIIHSQENEIQKLKEPITKCDFQLWKKQGLS